MLRKFSCLFSPILFASTFWVATFLIPTLFISTLLVPPSLFSSEIILDVPKVVQSWNNCGAANLSAVLSYWHHPVDQQTIAQKIRPHQNDPHVSLEELASQVPKELKQLIILVDHQTILTALRYRIPLLLPVWFSDSKGEQMAHYLTITGYSEKENIYWIMDSLGEYKSLPVAHLLALNEVMGSKALLIASPTEFKQFQKIPRKINKKNTKKINTTLPNYPENLMISRSNFLALNNLERAITALKENNLTKALTILNAIPRQDLPWRIFWYRGEALEIWFRGEDYLTLLTATEISLRPYPWSEELFYWKALALAYSGKEREARNALKKGKELHPEWFTPKRMARFPSQY